jgi:SulP family sulfate permease
VHEVDAQSLRADAMAGLLGAALVLPQALAFATLAGLPPAWGLYTAVVPCIVAALAGSSRHVLSGPTNAVSLAMAASLAPLAAVGSADYLRLAVVVTLAVGLIQTAAALLRLGRLANFISPSVMLGFTTGAAALIAWHAALQLAPDRWALAFGIGTLALTWGLRRAWPRAPFMLLALALAGATAWALMRWTGRAVEFVGALPQAWPAWQPPPLEWGDVRRLAGIALALTIVALGQSIAIAKLLAARAGQRLDVNRECLGQGLANITGSFFSCFVSSGSLNRSLPNLQAGARTPLAGVAAGVFALVLAVAAAPLIAWVPLAAVAGLLLWVAWGLVDIPQWRRVGRLDRGELGIAAATGLAMGVLPLEQAVLGGVGLSLISYLYRTSRPALRTMGFAPGTPGQAARPMVVLDGTPHAECPQLKLLRMEGSVYFAAVAHVSERLHALRHAPEPARHLLVMAKSMNFVDYAGATMWEEEHLHRLAAGGDLYFHRPRPEVVETWRERGFLDKLGPDHVFADKRSAIATIVPRLDDAICARCTARVFDECAARPRASAA